VFWARTGVPILMVPGASNKNGRPSQKLYTLKNHIYLNPLYKKKHNFHLKYQFAVQYATHSTVWGGSSITHTVLATALPARSL